MAAFNAKTWFRANIAPYLNTIKAWATTAIATAKGEAITDAVSQANTYTDSAVAGITASVAGVFKGAFDTHAEITALTGVKNGDWAVLRVDDNTDPLNAKESGIYIKGSGGWSFVMDITSINEAQALISNSSVNWATGSSSVAPSINLVKNQTAPKAGSASQAFAVLAAEENTDQAVNANQFAGPVTQAEANADWAAVASGG